MGYENKAGLNVNNAYGQRDTGGAIGNERATGVKQVMLFEFTGATLNGTFLPPFYLPTGARPSGYMLRVDEAFALTGTTPALSIGTAASLGADFVSLSKAELEAVGTKPPASNGTGTWHKNTSTGVTVPTKVGFGLTGTTPAVSPTQGRATLMVEYYVV